MSVTWQQLGQEIYGEASGDQSGYSVSINIDGTRFATSSPYNDGNGGNSGHCRIYEYDGTQWQQLGQDIDGEASSDQIVTISLNSAGDRVAMGANYNDGNGNNSGHTRIFEYNGSQWVQLGQDIDGDAANDELGRSVELNALGNRVVIGAPNNDSNGNN